MADIDDILLDADRSTTLPPIPTGRYDETGEEINLTVKVIDPEDPSILAAYFHAESRCTNKEGHVVDREGMDKAYKDLWDAVVHDPPKHHLTGSIVKVVGADEDGNQKTLEQHRVPDSKAKEIADELSEKYPDASVEVTDVMTRLSTRFKVGLNSAILKILGVDSFFNNLETMLGRPGLLKALAKSDMQSHGNTESPPNA